MKLFLKRTLAAILGGCLLLTALAACKSGNSGDQTTDQTGQAGQPGASADLVVFLKDGASDYSIVYAGSDPLSGVYMTACYNLASAIKETTGVDIPVLADITTDTAATGGKEILVGNTNRPESTEAAAGLRVGDYQIRVSGEKLLIVGGSAEKTADAVDRFSAMYFSQTQTSLILTADYLYEKTGSYTLDSVKFGANDLKDYRIVYGSDGQIPATILAAKIEERYGVILPTVSDQEAEQACEILVGATNRAQSSISVPAGEYAVKLDGEKLVIAGADANCTGGGVNAFLTKTLGTGEKEITVETLALSGKIETGASLKILDLNVTLSGYAENAVVNRYPRLYSLIQSYTPDILCLQEVSGTTWYDCITKGIGDTPALTDTYAFVGTPRNGTEPDYSAGLTGAYNAILYNKSLYKEEESGTFWLSATPTIPSVGWDGRTRAICTWVRLTDLATGRTFAVMNTQPDSYGKTAPQNGVELLCDVAASFDCPVILCADLVSNSSGKPYQAAASAGFLDSAAIAAECKNTGGTVNSYGASKESDKATDFIFTFMGRSTVSRWQRITDQVDGAYVSEHWALLAEINY